MSISTQRVGSRDRSPALYLLGRVAGLFGVMVAVIIVFMSFGLRRDPMLFAVDFACVVFGFVACARRFGLGLGRPTKLWSALMTIIGFQGLILGLVALGDDPKLTAQALFSPFLISNPWLLISVCVTGPINEELIFRGWMWAGVRSRYSIAVTAAVTTVLFLATHLLNYSILGLLGLLPLALCLGWLRCRCKSVWPCIVLHAIHNTMGLALGATV